jgi:uncharacterized protein YmfQ (DUF2313 family)
MTKLLAATTEGNDVNLRSLSNNNQFVDDKMEVVVADNKKRMVVVAAAASANYNSSTYDDASRCGKEDESMLAVTNNDNCIIVESSSSSSTRFQHILATSSTEDNLRVVATFYYDHVLETLFSGIKFQNVMNEFILSELNKASNGVQVKLDLGKYLESLSKLLPIISYYTIIIIIII